MGDSRFGGGFSGTDAAVNFAVKWDTTGAIGPLRDLAGEFEKVLQGQSSLGRKLTEHKKDVAQQMQEMAKEMASTAHKARDYIANLHKESSEIGEALFKKMANESLSGQALENMKRMAEGAKDTQNRIGEGLDILDQRYATIENKAEAILKEHEKIEKSIKHSAEATTGWITALNLANEAGERTASTYEKIKSTAESAIKVFGSLLPISAGYEASKKLYEMRELMPAAGSSRGFDDQGIRNLLRQSSNMLAGSGLHAEEFTGKQRMEAIKEAAELGISQKDIPQFVADVGKNMVGGLGIGAEGSKDMGEAVKIWDQLNNRMGLANQSIGPLVAQFQAVAQYSRLTRGDIERVLEVSEDIVVSIEDRREKEVALRNTMLEAAAVSNTSASMSSVQQVEEAARWATIDPQKSRMAQFYAAGAGISIQRFRDIAMGKVDGVTTLEVMQQAAKNWRHTGEMGGMGEDYLYRMAQEAGGPSYYELAKLIETNPEHKQLADVDAMRQATAAHGGKLEMPSEVGTFGGMEERFKENVDNAVTNFGLTFEKTMTDAGIKLNHMMHGVFGAMDTHPGAFGAASLGLGALSVIPGIARGGMWVMQLMQMRKMASAIKALNTARGLAQGLGLAGEAAGVAGTAGSAVAGAAGTAATGEAAALEAMIMASGGEAAATAGGTAATVAATGAGAGAATAAGGGVAALGGASLITIVGGVLASAAVGAIIGTLIDKFLKSKGWDLSDWMANKMSGPRHDQNGNTIKDVSDADYIATRKRLQETLAAAHRGAAPTTVTTHGTHYETLPEAVTSHGQGTVLAESGSSNIDRWDSLITKISTEEGVDPAFAKAIMTRESHGDPTALSNRGARGLMQVMPETGKDLGVNDPTKLYDPETNIRAGIKYIAMIQKMYAGRPDLMAAAYNAGPWNKELHEGHSVPHIEETQKYVSEVTKFYNQYKGNRLHDTGEKIVGLAGSSDHGVSLASVASSPKPWFKKQGHFWVDTGSGEMYNVNSKEGKLIAQGYDPKAPGSTPELAAQLHPESPQPVRMALSHEQLRAASYGSSEAAKMTSDLTKAADAKPLTIDELIARLQANAVPATQDKQEFSLAKIAESVVKPQMNDKTGAAEGSTHVASALDPAWKPFKSSFDTGMGFGGDAAPDLASLNPAPAPKHPETKIEVKQEDVVAELRQVKEAVVKLTLLLANQEAPSSSITNPFANRSEAYDSVTGLANFTG